MSTTIKKYVGYPGARAEEPELINCFFAFSNKQLEEGIKKHNLEGVKIFSGGGGLYGTNEGIKNLLQFYDNQSEYIKNNCNPQEVYLYEFDNHECSYIGSDDEAIKIVVSYFGEDIAKSVKRKYGYTNIDELKF